MTDRGARSQQANSLRKIPGKEVADCLGGIAVRMDGGDRDPSSAGTVGDGAVWGGSRTAAGMAANPLGAR